MHRLHNITQQGAVAVRLLSQDNNLVTFFNESIYHRKQSIKHIYHKQAKGHEFCLSLQSALLSAAISIYFDYSICLGLCAESAAGPSLFYHYGQLKLSMQRCISKGFEVLDRRALYSPSNIEGERNFALGENTNKMVIINCSQVESTGRVTLIAASSIELTLIYARNIYNSLLY